MANKYHFIGVNGIGMSALATVLAKQGHDVSARSFPKYKH